MSKSPMLSIVAPAYNEQKVLPLFHARLVDALTSVTDSYEIVYVDDGSSDDTPNVIRQIRDSDENTVLVELSRNFGKEIAMTAGLQASLGEAVVVIDTDLQDPPELISKFVERWNAGYDVVYAQRTRRADESFIKKATASWFYRIMQRFGPVAIPKDTGDYRLLSRRAVDAVLKFREHHRFMKGVFTWIGYKQVAVPYEREGRADGETKWNYWKLWNFALEGITSFTLGPLKIATYAGVLTSLFAFIYGFVIIIRTLVFGRDLPGYPSLMVVILFLGGIQLIALGIIGEYLGRTFNETKNRPLYFVSEYLPRRSSEGSDQESDDRSG